MPPPPLNSPEGPSPPEEELTVLMVGDGDPLQEGIQAALESRSVLVERSAVVGVAQAAIALAPDLVLLVGDAAADGGTDVLGRLSASPLAAVLPVVLLADQDDVSDRVKAFRFGATAIVPRSASVDGIATKVTELVSEIPERSAETSGVIGEATLAEFTEMLSKELRNGILSIKGPGAKDETQVRLVLGEGRAVANAVESFVARVKPLIHEAELVRYEFQEHAGGTLDLLNGDSDIPEVQAGASVAGMRLLLADDDVARADAVGQELRTRGANVVITDTKGSRIERARSLDPAVLIIGNAAIEGHGYDLVRRLREDVRLRWAYLLVVAWDEIWSAEAPGPVVENLVARVARLGETERSLREKARSGEAFDTRIEATGPARLLRTLAEGNESLRATVQNRRAHIRIDLSEGLIAGASCTMHGGDAEGAAKLRGSLALAALLQTATGRVHVSPVSSPADANIMAPIDAALASALAEAAPLGPSEVIHPEAPNPDADRIGSARLAAPSGDPAMLPDIGSAVPARGGTTHHGYALPKRPLRREPMAPLRGNAGPVGSPGHSGASPSVSPGLLAAPGGTAPSIPPHKTSGTAAAPKRDATLVGMPVVRNKARSQSSGANKGIPKMPAPAVSLAQAATLPPSSATTSSEPSTGGTSAPPGDVANWEDEKTTPGTTALLEPMMAMSARDDERAPTGPVPDELFGTPYSDETWSTGSTRPRWGRWLLVVLAACLVAAGATWFIGRSGLLGSGLSGAPLTAETGSPPDPGSEPLGVNPEDRTGPERPEESAEPNAGEPATVASWTTEEGSGGAETQTSTETPASPLAILDTPVTLEPPPPPRRVRRLGRRQRIARSRIAQRRGNRMMGRQRYREAREHFENSLEYDPNHAAAWKGMALALHRLGDEDLSFEYLRKALELDPENAEYFLLLGDAFGSRNQDGAARAAWERALELDPRLRPARRRLSRLR